MRGLSSSTIDAIVLWTVFALIGLAGAIISAVQVYRLVIIP